ncbi:helix-turn-helix domain-containing protein [Paenibacillus sinopodophylli]|uniref:helix-turn-helix domain-containing protein n=1 Tax=Paenibacillus sinopodophylli TaxID=1837342 RepID=UPI00110CF932|nr:helix-turn-helix transcriptional regulator [Paenibacillus sinopodophylli]
MSYPKTSIEKHRRTKYLNQADVSSELGMSVVNYSKIERGQRRLTVDVALKLVKIFELNSIEELIEKETLEVV